MDIECAGFTFLSNFESGNLDRVELVPRKNNASSVAAKNGSSDDVPDFEFNIWTRPDCHGTEFENSNRTWFYFGIRGGTPSAVVKLNIVNLNKQSKMYSQGMAPVYKIVPGRHGWDRIKEKPTFVIEDNVFILSFKYRSLENRRSTIYFAFTYPYTYADLQNMLRALDKRFKNLEDEDPKVCLDDIYYHRECVCYSLERRRIDLITISSFHNKSLEREPRLKYLFPEINVPRPFKFLAKKVIFISARVHPGETPSSFVFNGFLKLLLNRDDPYAILLRKSYVFKLIPFLNPDGVVRGHYRTDTRGINLNRMYLNPSLTLHPSIFAARALIRYYHYGQELEDNLSEDCFWNLQNSSSSDHILCNDHSDEHLSSSPEDRIDRLDEQIENRVSGLTLDENKSKNSSSISYESNELQDQGEVEQTVNKANTEIMNTDYDDMFSSICENIFKNVFTTVTQNYSNNPSCKKSLKPRLFGSEPSTSDTLNATAALSNLFIQQKNLLTPSETADSFTCNPSSISDFDGNFPVHSNTDSPGRISAIGVGSSPELEESGIFLYVDLHGHASKKGIFMYGNHFVDEEESIECMLLPKIMSINSQNFHFTACNFTERNMYCRDRRDGLSKEGSGRVAVFKTTGLIRSYTLECNYNTGRVVNVLPPCLRENAKSHPQSQHLLPPKYTPQIFEEAGRALGISILDLMGQNPWSRIPNSEFRTLGGIREWLRTACIPEQTYLRKTYRTQKHFRNHQSSSQVAAAGKALARPTSSDTALRSYTRTHKLAPLGSKVISKISGSENAAEERKENVSGYSLGSTPRTISNVRTVRSFPSPKSSMNPCTSQRNSISGLKRVKGNHGGTGPCIVKQVLAVRKKCAAGATVPGKSKVGSNFHSSRSLDPVGVNKKNVQSTPVPAAHLSSIRLSSTSSPSSSGVGLSKSDEDQSKIFIKSVSHSTTSLGRVASVGRFKGSKDDGKGFDELIVKQGSKRLKISPASSGLSVNLDTGNSIIEMPPAEANIYSDLTPSVRASILPEETKSIELKSSTSSWDSQYSNLEIDPCSSVLLGNKSSRTKQKLSPSLLNPIPQIRKFDMQGTNKLGKIKCNTKPDKQGKAKPPNLSPIKLLKKSPSFGKKINSELSKKRGKGSIRNLASTAAKLRKSFSGELTIDKKRKRCKPKLQ